MSDKHNEKLTQYLLQSLKEEITLTLEELASITGPLPDIALKYPHIFI